MPSTMRLSRLPSKPRMLILSLEPLRLVAPLTLLPVRMVCLTSTSNSSENKSLIFLTPRRSISSLVMVEMVAGVSRLDFSPRVAKTLTVPKVP